jgi:heparanase
VLARHAGRVALLAINTDRTASHTLTVPMAGLRYTLSSDRLDGQRVQLNGKELALGPADAIPAFEGAATTAGTVTLAPTTITFLTIPTAGNGVCR